MMHHGSEKASNALRIAPQLQKENPKPEVRLFLMADAATCAIPLPHSSLSNRSHLLFF